MRRRTSSLVASALTALLSGFVVVGGAALADGPPAPPPVAPAPVAPAPGAPPPAAPAPGDAKPAEAGMRRTVSMKALEERIFDRPAAAATFLVLKFGTAIAGVVVLILAWSRRRDVRRGLAPPPRPGSPPPEAVGLVPAIALVLLATQGGGVLQLLLAGLPGGWSSATDPIGVSIACTALAMVGVAVFAAGAIRLKRTPDGARPWPAVRGARAAVATFLVSSAVVLVLSLAATLAIQHFLGREPMAQDLIGHVLDPVHPRDPWLIAVFGVLVAPVTEEYVFRGMLYPALRGVAGRWGGAVVASAVFAGVHLDLAATLPLFGLAMLLTLLYERTGSILAVALMHALNNATSLLPLFLIR